MPPLRAGVLPAVLAMATAFPAAADERRFQGWRALRDAGVVRQQRDFSCGIAALATLLTHYFRQPADEEALLAALFASEQGDAARAELLQRGVSLAALASLARQRGLAARGVSLPAAAIGRLRVPAIAYLEVDGEAHFTVIRAVSERAVQLADPSWGNVRWPRWRFHRAFSDAGGRGRLLLLASAGAVQEDWVRMDRPLPLLRPPPG